MRGLLFSSLLFFISVAYGQNDFVPNLDFQNFEKMSYTITPDGPISEGDILLSPFSYQKAIKGVVTRFKMRKWKNGIVPYVIDNAVPNKTDILNAIEHYHQFTTIRFVPRTNQKDYVFIKYNGKEGGCNSFIGRKGGKQVINFPEWCKRGGMIHEMAHALGLYHEHTRPDRNKFINVNWSNIDFKQWHNFIRVPWAKTNGDFDFNSIMLYSSFNGFAKDPKVPTITKLDGSTFRANRESLGQTDLETLENLYQ